MVSDQRKYKLEQARHSFHTEKKQVNVRRSNSVCRHNGRNGYICNDSAINEEPPYWSGYLLRSIVVVVLLLCVYLYGLSNTSQQKKICNLVRENFKENASFDEAYQTYRTLDYQDAYQKMMSYAKHVLTR